METPVRTGIYFCNCGTNISEKIDCAEVRRLVENMPGFAYFKSQDFLCSETGATAMETDIRENRPDRVVVAACSVRDHEETFRAVLGRAGLNPYLMQMVNIREHIAWVTEDKRRATGKAAGYIRAAMARVALHEPLEKEMIDICPDVLVIGAGPAGLKAALTLAEAGRKVCLVEKGPVLGGMPVKYEEVFPRMECGPCLLEPVLGEALHGPQAGNLEILTLAEVTEVIGFYGNFTATIRQEPRYISPELCIACAECIAPCPVAAENPFNFGLNRKKAVDFPFLGALPNLPFIDPHSCLRTTRNEECHLCRDACPVEGAVNLGDAPKVVSRQVGAIVAATGAEAYDCAKLPNLGYGRLKDVYTSLEFERILAASGPTAGALVKADGQPPRRIAIIHCVGSLDPNHVPYCSGVCCENAFKFNSLIAHKVPGAEVTHFFKEIAVAGKEESALLEKARSRNSTRMIRFDDISQLTVSADGDGVLAVTRERVNGKPKQAEFDMIVLCPALVPSKGTGAVAQLLELDTDEHGFLEELHGRMDSARSKVRGIYLAGTCQGPMDIQKAVNQGLAASGYVLSGLVPGRQLAIEPVTAAVDARRCSGCRTCISVCPYKAITFDTAADAAAVNRVLCLGCGTCVAACPNAAIKGNHFTNEEIYAEIEQVLS